jgi:signal transduction histidine kinase
MKRPDQPVGHEAATPDAHAPVTPAAPADAQSAARPAAQATAAEAFPFAIPGDRDHLHQLGLLAGGLVHELKNPLGVMLLNAELLLSQSASLAAGPEERERLDKRLRRIRDSGRSLQAIVQSFLAFARPARPDPDAVDINALLTALIEEQSDLNERADVAVALHPDPDLALVPADAEHLRSVFRNVLKNAREALSERASTRRILVVTRSAPGMARVVIANNGPPLPEKVAARLFEPFTSSKEGGTGLGLAIVRRLVEMHHGRVAVSSDPDQGVSFTFEFPTPLGPGRTPPPLPQPAVDAVVRDVPPVKPAKAPRRRPRSGSSSTSTPTPTTDSAPAPAAPANARGRRSAARPAG